MPSGWAQSALHDATALATRITNKGAGAPDVHDAAAAVRLEITPKLTPNPRAEVIQVTLDPRLREALATEDRRASHQPIGSAEARCNSAVQSARNSLPGVWLLTAVASSVDGLSLSAG